MTHPALRYLEGLTCYRVRIHMAEGRPVRMLVVTAPSPEEAEQRALNLYREHVGDVEWVRELHPATLHLDDGRQ